MKEFYLKGKTNISQLDSKLLLSWQITTLLNNIVLNSHLCKDFPDRKCIWYIYLKIKSSYRCNSGSNVYKIKHKGIEKVSNLLWKQNVPSVNKAGIDFASGSWKVLSDFYLASKLMIYQDIWHTDIILTRHKTNNISIFLTL